MADGATLSSGVQRVFVVGSPRSGTTWLHQMIAEHPKVASIPQELTVFSRYLAPVVNGYERERWNMERGAWKQGLPLLYSAEEFQQGLSGILEAIYARVHAKRPGATHILDKHPGYSLHLPLIDRFVPDARYVHIIRDGREVAVSMISAHRRVGFGAGEMESAAREWHACTTKAMSFGRDVGPRYIEVRYEDLVSDTATTLTSIFKRIGLDADQEFVDRIAAEYHIDKKQVSRGDTAVNAIRNQPGAIWRSGMSLRERYIFHRVAGALLVRLGYAVPRWWCFAPWQWPFALLYPLYSRLKQTARSMQRVWFSPAIKSEG